MVIPEKRTTPRVFPLNCGPRFGLCKIKPSINAMAMIMVIKINLLLNKKQDLPQKVNSE